LATIRLGSNQEVARSSPNHVSREVVFNTWLRFLQVEQLIARNGLFVALHHSMLIWWRGSQPTAELRKQSSFDSLSGDLVVTLTIYRHSARIGARGKRHTNRWLGQVAFLDLRERGFWDPGDELLLVAVVTPRLLPLESKCRNAVIVRIALSCDEMSLDLRFGTAEWREEQSAIRPLTKSQSCLIL
jgi:hypothetical protein